MGNIQRALFVAGGTGGHIYPALTVAEELRARRPDVDIAFVGSERRMEADLIPKAGFRFIPVSAAGFPRGLTMQWTLVACRVGLGFVQVVGILRRERPSVVFGTGGYVCGPLIGAAAICGIPTVIHETNAVPGLTNAWLGRVVRHILVGFEDAARHFPDRKTRVTGNPIRHAIVSGCAKKTERPIGDAEFRLLVMGGSLGSRRINDAVVNALPALAQMPIRLIHQTGQGEFASVRDAYDRFFASQDARSAIAARFQVVAFIDDPGERFAESDLLICRSGAMTISEAMFCGLPCIMVPFPAAKRDEQRRNAESVANAGAGVIIQDSRFTGERLLDSLRPFVASRKRVAEAARRCQDVARPNATHDIVQLLEKYL